MGDFPDDLYPDRRSRRGARLDHRAQRKGAAHGSNAFVFSEAAFCGGALSGPSVSGFVLLIVNGLTNLMAAVLLLRREEEKVKDSP